MAERTMVEALKDLRQILAWAYDVLCEADLALADSPFDEKIVRARIQHVCRAINAESPERDHETGRPHGSPGGANPVSP